tara:strand:+ start:133 stop:327 length:195 start_codon:yes stop_codon:yes gene_type:complete
MDIVQFATALYKVLDSREEDLKEFLANGSIESIEDYRNVTGQIQGICFVRQEMRTLLERYEEDD